MEATATAEERAAKAEARAAKAEEQVAALTAMVAKLSAQLGAGLPAEAEQAVPPRTPRSLREDSEAQESSRAEQEVPPPLASEDSDEKREAMRLYWEQQSGGEGSMLGATVEAMMLDKDASKIDQAERPEILGMLPDLTGLDMIEMGAGIGRMTGDLAKQAKTVLACDFVDVSIKANEAAHAHMGNCEFLCADATTMDRPAESLDVVFSNWLLMYFGDAEVQELFAKSLRWLRPGGYLFFRESCFHQSGNAKRNENPTEYRSPGEYFDMATQQMQMVDRANGDCFVFELITQKALQSYVELKGNHNQIAWLFQKRATTFTRAPTQGAVLQTYLDTQRYTTQAIKIYERMYGDGYVSCGGKETTTGLVQSLNLKPGERILDVGCGTGGGWQENAYEHQVHVVGVDLSVNMVNLALERRVNIAKHQDVSKRQLCDVAFEVADIMTREFEDNSFDVIYSRDSILHIEDKTALFERLFRWLKPGGRLLITDYCRADKDTEVSEEFAEYISRRNYSLLDPDDYGAIISSAGFADVVPEDNTDQMVSCMNRELATIRAPAAAGEFKKDFGDGDYDALLEGWESKLEVRAACCAAALPPPPLPAACRLLPATWLLIVLPSSDASCCCWCAFQPRAC